MSDSVMIIMVLCATYVLVTLINRLNPIRGKHEAKRKDGAK